MILIAFLAGAIVLLVGILIGVVIQQTANDRARNANND